MNRVDRYYVETLSRPPQALRRTQNTMLMLPPPPLVDSGVSSQSRSSTWTSYNSGTSAGGFALLEHGECIKPERTNKRNNIQKLQWRNSRWVDGFPGEEFDQRLSSMTIADVSPRFAVKRIILLYENFQYREAANFINRLSHGTFKVILNDLPIDLFVESMPHSLSILEALYAKVFLSDGLNFSMKLLRPDGVIMQMVKFFSSQEIEKASGKWELCGPFICSCKKLLKVIVLSDPKVKKVLQARRRTLDKAIEGLGAHGLVGTTDETLTNLHDALKVEFQRVVETYKGALQKLEELSLAGHNNNGVSKGPAPVQASHQRQLTLKKPDIQDRLIKNKTLLNVVEPTLGNHSLDILLGILQRRIDYDKDVLFQFTQLKNEMKDVEAGAVVAPVLMRYSHGCEQVLELMKEVAEDDEDSSDISGYHSDSDSAIMMSGNSPYVSKRARYNFLTRSVRSTNKCNGRTPLQNMSSGVGSTSSDSPPGSLLGPGRKTMGTASCSPDNCSTTSSNNSSTLRASPRQVKHKSQLSKLNASNLSSSSVPCCQSCQPRASLQVLPPSESGEVAALRAEMESLRAELNRSNMRVQVCLESERQLKDRLANCPPPSPLGEGGVSRDTLVRRYSELYNRARVDTLDALDNLPQLRESQELKSKILFSVIVLAFRSAQSLLALKRDHVRRILHIPTPPANGLHLDPHTTALENNIQAYLRTTVEHFDLTKVGEEVSSQIWATLYDYPCLKSCAGLVEYVKEAVRLAWALVNQAPAFHLEYEQRVVRKDVHVRFHTSNLDTEHIRTYLWPALLEGQGGPCVHKAVVIT